MSNIENIQELNSVATELNQIWSEMFENHYDCKPHNLFSITRKGTGLFLNLDAEMGIFATKAFLKIKESLETLNKFEAREMKNGGIFVSKVVVLPPKDPQLKMVEFQQNYNAWAFMAWIDPMPLNCRIDGDKVTLSAETEILEEFVNWANDHNSKNEGLRFSADVHYQSLLDGVLSSESQWNDMRSELTFDLPEAYLVPMEYRFFKGGELQRLELNVPYSRRMDLAPLNAWEYSFWRLGKTAPKLDLRKVVLDTETKVSDHHTVGLRTEDALDIKTQQLNEIRF